MDNTLIILIILCLLLLIFNINEIKKASSLPVKSDRLLVYATQIVLFVGVFLRIIYLEYPFGINMDEAIAGYDAWCIAHYGIDQHLNSYPVYLKSWGSGQSALYAYLSAPFVKLFGLTLSAHRLPMAIVSSAALVSLYYTIRKIGLNQFFIFVLTLFFVFNPWHFTKSRWALDCNLAPDLVLIGTCLITLAYYNNVIKKQVILYSLGFVAFGLAAYGYAVAWFMLPIYCVLLLVFLYKKKKITPKGILISVITALVITAPLILFAIELMTKGSGYHIGPITIPQLNESRHETTTIIGASFAELMDYLFYTFKSLATGYDHLLTNSFPYTGQFYNPIGWIFILITFIYFIRKRQLQTLDYLFLFWLIACIPIILFVSYNVNRWNMIWIPLIYFCARGIDLCIAKRTIPKIVAAIVFTFLTVIFSLNYAMIHDKGFLAGVEESIKVTASPSIETVYFPETLQYPVILFYDPISPVELNRTKVAVDSNAAFIHLMKFGKYNAGIPSSIAPKAKTAYIIPNGQVESTDINLSLFNVDRNEVYTVLWND